LAQYGYIPYNKHFIGQIQQTDPIDACQPLKNHNYNQASQILLAKRGNCTFLTKSNHAQIVGAKLLLIADSFEEDEKLVTMIGDG
jgi:hypothetical protein